LVIHAIFHKENKGLSKGEIKETIKELYGLQVEKHLLSESLQRLRSENHLVPFIKKRYVITEEKVKEASSHVQDYTKIKEAVIAQFLSIVKENYPDLPKNDEEIVADCFLSTIFLLFEKYGSLCSNIIKGGTTIDENLTSLPDFQVICNKELKKIANSYLRKSVKFSFRNYITNPTAELANFLFCLAQSYTIAQIMNVDPELQALQANRLSERRMYLDTNILISLMTTEEAELVRKVINHSRRLGVKMFYTQRTAKEFEVMLNNSKNLYNKIPTKKESIIRKVEPLMEDPLVKMFWQETKTNKQLTWKGFLISKEAFKEVLSEKYGIVMDTPEFKIDQYDPQFQEMADACFYSSEDKNTPAVVHDAYHLLLIQHLRENETVDELGFKTYFLTRDRTLNFAENKVCKDDGGFSSLHITTWLQMISPFLSPKIDFGEASDAYVRLLGSLFPSLTKSTDPDVLVSIMGVWMDDPSINTETLRRIIGSKYMKENYEKIREIAKETPSKISKVIDPLIQMIISQVNKENEEKIANVERQYSEKIAILEEKISSSPPTPPHKPSLKYLLVIGAILLVTMVAIAIASTTLEWNMPDIIYGILGSGGIALIASYFFGEKALGKFKG
jgi:hypothetical protein